jgi:hypothetical protein
VVTFSLPNYTLSAGAPAGVALAAAAVALGLVAVGPLGDRAAAVLAGLAAVLARLRAVRARAGLTALVAARQAGRGQGGEQQAEGQGRPSASTTCGTRWPGRRKEGSTPYGRWCQLPSRWAFNLAAF